MDFVRASSRLIKLQEKRTIKVKSEIFDEILNSLDENQNPSPHNNNENSEIILYSTIDDTSNFMENNNLDNILDNNEYLQDNLTGFETNKNSNNYVSKYMYNMYNINITLFLKEPRDSR
jgi:hypothetical protein